MFTAVVYESYAREYVGKTVLADLDTVRAFIEALPRSQYCDIVDNQWNEVDSSTIWSSEWEE